MTQQSFQPDENRNGVFVECSAEPPLVILFMDDEWSILEPFGKLLELKGFVVYTAFNGEEAVEIYRQALSSKKKVDVAIIDLTIPEGMGGVETIARIREIDPDVQAIATTGHFQDCLTEEYKKFGFVAILPKPFILKELLDAIDEVTGKRANTLE
jgi:two-component system, cell cycle sensor histidine kinase and response regulator CckA